MSEMAVLTREALDDELSDGVTDVLAERVRGGSALGWITPPTRDEIAALLNQLCASGRRDTCAVVDLDEGVELAVAGNFAGRGIGRSLLNELIEQARTAGICQLTLDFRGDNAAAEALYLSVGFEEYGRLRDFVSPGNAELHDKVLHVLRLVETSE